MFHTPAHKQAPLLTYAALSAGLDNCAFHGYGLARGIARLPGPQRARANSEFNLLLIKQAYLRSVLHLSAWAAQ